MGQPDMFKVDAHLTDGSDLLFAQSERGGKLQVWRAGQHLFNVNFSAPNMPNTLARKLYGLGINSETEPSVEEAINQAATASEEWRRERWGEKELSELSLEYDYPAQLNVGLNHTANMLAATVLLQAANEIIQRATTLMQDAG